MTSTSSPTRLGRRQILILLGVVGLLAGLPAGYGVGKLIKLAKQAGPVGWSAELSLGIATLLIIGGVAILLATITNASAAYLADPHDEGPIRKLRPGQLTYFRLQGGVLTLAGLMMAAPELIHILAPSLSGSLAGASYLALVATFALQTVLNIQLYRRSDELIRRTTADAGSACFWLLQALLFLWAAGEKLALLPHLNSWDAFTVLMSVYLFMSAAVAYRRGFR